MGKHKFKLGKGLMGKPVLILNADYKPLSKFPLSVRNMKKVLKAIIKDRVSVVEEYDDIVYTDKSSFKLPKVVVLKKYININHTPKFSRKNIYLRDNYTCQYCGKEYSYDKLTFDHLIPRHMGGETNWDNIVTACTDCNGKKGGRLLQDSKLTLLSYPKVPTMGELERNAEKRGQKGFDLWSQYF